MRLSVAVVWNRYTHGSFAKSRASASPSSPPSPSVPETPGTVPTTVFWPVGLTCPIGSWPDRVVAVTGPPGGDTWRAASEATTVNVYGVSGARPATVAVVVVAVATTVVPLRTV